MASETGFATALAGLLILASAQAAPPVHKCEVNGTITFQHTACPTGQVRDAPTVGQLNAERKKRLEAASAAGAGRTAAAPAPGPSIDDGANSRAPVVPTGQFKCDGRTHCSQMASCAEAKYFLDHCPGVTMDGDRNGIPCEQQWCGGSPGSRSSRRR